MRYVLIGFILVLCCVTVGQAKVSDPEQQVIDRLALAAVPDKEIDVAECALSIASTSFPEVDIREYAGRINKMARDISDRLKTTGIQDAPEHEKIIAAINQYLYENIKIKSESILTDNTNNPNPPRRSSGLRAAPPEVDKNKFLLNRVIDNLNGNCLGLTTLYWSLAERLNLPLEAVIIPQHVFLRYYSSRAKYRNIEPTSNGAEISDADYIKNTKKLMGTAIPKFTTPAEVKFQVLSKKGFVGLIIYNRGVDYLKHSEPARAIADFSNSLRLVPELPDNYKNRGVLYIKDGKYTDAAKDFRQAMRLEPDCPLSYFNLGVAYLNLNELRDARKNFDRAINLAAEQRRSPDYFGDDYADAYLNGGLVYYKLGQMNPALKSITGAIEILQETITRGEADDETNDSLARAYYNRGLVYFGLKDYQSAISDYIRSIEIKDAYAEAYHNRGVAYAMLEQFSEAAGDMEKAYALLADQTDAEARDLLRNLGVTYYRLKDYKQSLERLEKYLELKPDDKEAQDMVNALKERLKN